jgi:hypothetical protein
MHVKDLGHVMGVLCRFTFKLLFRRARISPCALMMGILYTERLAQSNPNYLKKVSSSDLFMVSMVSFFTIFLMV